MSPLLYHVVAWVGKDSLLPSPAEAGGESDPAPYNMQFLGEQALSPPAQHSRGDPVDRVMAEPALRV